MPTRTARSTASQRVALAKLEDDLQEAFDSLDGRFWSTHDQREAYQIVLHHLRAWAFYERNDEL